MEIMVPVSNMDFDFKKKTSSSPYLNLSAPSSPKRFGQFFFSSAPTSPNRISEFYQEFDNFCLLHDDENNNGSSRRSEFSSAIPFDWEEKPGTPKSPKSESEDDFAFNFSVELEKTSLSAEELFDGGKIRPLKPPPRLQIDDYSNQKSPLMSPRSPISPKISTRKIIREAFSPRNKKGMTDPFTTAIENTRQGREKKVHDPHHHHHRRPSRSLSPFRVSAYPWEEEEQETKQQQQQETKQQQQKQSELLLQTSKPSSSSSSSRKWRLRDFFLFRSASEGRAADKDPSSKYANLFFRRSTEDTKNSSFRSIDSSGSVSSSRRRGPVSAHELHYTQNKAASQDLKKRTYLPYKQGILGRFAFR